MRYFRSGFDFLFSKNMDSLSCRALYIKCIWFKGKLSGERQAQGTKTLRPNRKILHPIPLDRTLTTQQYLLQSLDWPLSALMPGKCSLCAGTSVLLYYGHLKAVWSLQNLFSGGLGGGGGGGGIAAFSCAGCFHSTLPNDSVWHRLDTHQDHRCLPSQCGRLFSVK